MNTILRRGALLTTGLSGFLFMAASVAATGQEAPPAEPPPVIIVPQPAPPPPPLPPREPTTSFTFSGGWARLESDGDSLVDGEDGYYFDLDFSFRGDVESPLWFGISFNGSYFDDDRETVIDTGVIPTELEVYGQLSNFAIEPRLTFVLLPRRDSGIYLAGRLGAGLLITDYWATSVVERPGGFFVDSEGDTVAAFEVRPGVQVGYAGGAWAVGAEASNMWAWGDFGPIGDELQESRIGIFFTLRY